MEMELSKEEFSEALSNEKWRIQEALFSVGYFAPIVRFIPVRGRLPRLEIEAFPAKEDDRKHFG
jgi:hypothetical protein